MTHGTKPNPGQATTRRLVMELTRVFSGSDVNTERSTRFILFNDGIRGITN
jgi:hypothetical protein